MTAKIGRALVVGGGVGGIRSALELADLGYCVTLIDRAPHLGGTLSQLDRQFPSDHCGMCKMLPMVERESASQHCLRRGLSHERIAISLATELIGLEGEPGRFRATLRREPVFVDPKACTGCGVCAKACPVEVPDSFNAGLSQRKAIYLPVPHQIPNGYVVDPKACTRCGACEPVCPTGAIDLRREARRAFRILVVDDELVVRDSTKEWLEDAGFSVAMAASGAEALAELESHPFHLMFLDVKMPGMDGVEVLARAREIAPEMPVVMMTAYATVETAVSAMKLGARDYLLKPFDPEALLAIAGELYKGVEPPQEETIEVGAVVLAAGFGSFDPTGGLYGYGELPNVVTSTEFERLLSGTGPHGGSPLRGMDGREVHRVAWLQCVGSRSAEADFCSSACCMISIKEAQLARQAGAVETAVFYMDLRTYGKGFQRYRDRAEKEEGVRFVRSRIHSVEPEGGALRLTYADVGGAMHDEIFDLVVLAVGQRPPAGAAELAEAAGVELGPGGFCRRSGFSLSRTAKEGIFVSGSFSGLQDISDSLIQAGSAALGASACLHARGGGLSEVSRTSVRDVSGELPQPVLALCSCGGTLDAPLAGLSLSRPVVRIERLCTQEGLEALRAHCESSRANRLVLGACLPYVSSLECKRLGEAVGLPAALVAAVDIRSAGASARIELEMAIARLMEADPAEAMEVPIDPKALVVGGGIAGMAAALAIADHGYEVNLIERSDALGGNLLALYRSLDGEAPRELLEKTIGQVQSHPKIHCFTNARVVHSKGRAGRFVTTIETAEGSAEVLTHGVAILATGGREATTRSYGYGQSERILTQHGLEARLGSGRVDPAALQGVAFIQCVDSRDETRPYCSRICCASSLKQALWLKERNPELDVTILYRDLMAYGTLEAEYTRARRSGVLFVQYEPSRKPKVSVEGERVDLRVVDPILDRTLILSPDLLVLATGIVPHDQRDLAECFGVPLDPDGFFTEAESKWRPVDFIKEGLFLCGVAHSPRSVAESVAMAEAAASRALRFLTRGRIAVDYATAFVRHSLCALCERCIDACPYGARWRDEDRIMVDPLACQGCGSCATVCANSASVVRGHRDQQMFAALDAAL